MTCGPGRCHLKPIIGVPPPHTHYDSECEAGGYERRRSSRHSSGASTHTPPHLPVRTRSLAPERGPVASVGQAPTRGPWRIALRTPPFSHTHPPRRGAVRHGAADPPTLATATAGAGCGGGGMSETRRGINGHRGRDDPATTPRARAAQQGLPTPPMRALDRAGGHATGGPLHARTPVGAGGLLPRRTGKEGRAGGGVLDRRRAIGEGIRTPDGLALRACLRASGRFGSVLVDHDEIRPVVPWHTNYLAVPVTRCAYMRCQRQSRVWATVVAFSPPLVGVAVAEPPPLVGSEACRRATAFRTTVDPSVDGPACHSAWVVARGRFDRQKPGMTGWPLLFLLVTVGLMEERQKRRLYGHLCPWKHRLLRSEILRVDQVERTVHPSLSHL